MKTKKELNELSNAIGKAERAYYNAIKENLKESGKEHSVESDDEDEDGLHVTTTDRHDNNVIAVIDKVRFNGLLALSLREGHHAFSIVSQTKV